MSIHERLNLLDQIVELDSNLIEVHDQLFSDRTSRDEKVRLWEVVGQLREERRELQAKLGATNR
jgi:hypothetical protein